MNLREDLLRVRTPLVSFYVLKQDSALHLIDGGFIGGVTFLERALRKHGWGGLPIKGILLTHGHLDHILNVAKLVEMSGARVAAPGLDSAFYRGRPNYKGISRLTGRLEAVGRSVLGFRPFDLDRELADGDWIDLWGGLQVVHLPGHTAGHSGFYSPSRELLFCGDLFASFGKFSHLPPTFLNRDSGEVRRSVQKALELRLEGVLPNHGDRSTPQTHLERLKRFVDRP